MDNTIETAAKILVAANQSKEWIPELPSSIRPTSLEAAYAIQERSYKLSGRTAVGWKIGCTSNQIQQLLGSDQPIAGRLFTDTVYQSQEPISNYRSDMMLIEAEFAFKMKTDLPPNKQPYDFNTVKQAVDSILPAIEIVHERYSNWQKSSLLEKIADNSGFGSLILGAPCPVEQIELLEEKSVLIKFDNKIVGNGTANLVLGNPYNALVWLANMLSARGIGLSAGDIITSGSCTGLLEVPNDIQVTAEFDSLGSVGFTFK